MKKVIVNGKDITEAVEMFEKIGYLYEREDGEPFINFINEKTKTPFNRTMLKLIRISVVDFVKIHIFRSCKETGVLYFVELSVFEHKAISKVIELLEE